MQKVTSDSLLPTPLQPFRASSSTRYACCGSKYSVVPLPAVSSAECVAVLEGVGFAVASTTEGCTLLEGRGRLVVVPDDPILDYEVLCMVLSAAGMTALEFLELLDAPLPIVHARSA